MPVLALALLLSAAVGHATWNYVAKGARNDLAFTFLLVVASEVVYLPIALGVFLWTQPHIGWQALIWVTVSGSFHITYYYLLTQGYRVGDLSLVYPLARGTGPAIATIGAIIIYGERPGPVALLGTLLVVTGIVVMTWSPRARGGGEVGRSVVFALATGGVIASYTLWDKHGVTIVTPVLYSYGIDGARVVLTAPFALATRDARASLTAAWRNTAQRNAAIVIGVLSPAAYILVLIALSLAPVTYVAPAREISILFGAVIGWRLLSESDPHRRMLGAAAIVAGIFALALG
jgi:drug/metabolite transporter (DMT)-like permease